MEGRGRGKNTCAITITEMGGGLCMKGGVCLQNGTVFMFYGVLYVAYIFPHHALHTVYTKTSRLMANGNDCKFTQARVCITRYYAILSYMSV